MTRLEHHYSRPSLRLSFLPTCIPDRGVGGGEDWQRRRREKEQRDEGGGGGGGGRAGRHAATAGGAAPVADFLPLTCSVSRRGNDPHITSEKRLHSRLQNKNRDTSFKNVPAHVALFGFLFYLLK